jgi:hypothetical protein
MSLPQSADDRLQALIDARKGDERFDPEVWRFMDQISRNLQNVPEADLCERWRSIAKNILYVVGPARDIERIETKAFSSWWWLQTLVHTEAELERRGLPKPQAPNVPLAVWLRPEFRAERATLPCLWARVGEAKHLLKTLHQGEIRFRPASSYADSGLNEARRDPELEKIRKRPGQALMMTGPNGRRLNPIGDVNFARHSAIEVDGILRDVEYWMSSWSLEFDARLFGEFSKGDVTACDACLVAWDMTALGERVESAVHRDLKGWRFADIAVRYFDPYDLQPDRALPASMEKDFIFGYQRELRLCLGSPTPIERGDPIFLKVGSLADIAGLYDAGGSKIGGMGPDTFLASP